MKIIVENLSKKFDSNIVLNNINLKFEEGKTYGIIGRNGSGKSVLFKILCGFYKPTSGKVLVDGVDIHSNESFLFDARSLIEKPAFLPDLSGFENLQLLASIQKKITDKDIHETLDLVCLSKEDRNKKFHKYSLGMKQKLGIAQVLMEDPKIMIFDEPFNGLEEESLKKIREHIKSLNGSSKIILLASHMKEDIEKLCDEVYRIDNGLVEKIDYRI